MLPKVAEPDLLAGVRIEPVEERTPGLRRVEIGARIRRYD